MAAITPITMFNNTEASTTSTSEQDLSRKTSALADGVEYLVFYYANCGGSDTSALPEMALRFGATGSLTSGTRLARVIAEGRGTSNHWDSTQLQGFTLVTGNGTNVLGFTGFTATSSDTAYFGACGIVAIPTTDFPANTLYFSGTDSETDEVTNASTSGETLRSYAPTGMPAGDYLVMACAEVDIDSASASNGYTFDADVDSDTSFLMSVIGQEEAEDSADRCSVNCASVLTLGAGAHTFRITCGSQGSATCDWSRSRILALRLEPFDQHVQTTRSTTLNTTASSFGTDSMCSFTYTPNQTEYVLLLGAFYRHTGTFDTCCERIQNVTDGTSFCENSGEYNNQSADDQLYGVPIGCEQITGAKNYRIDVRTNAGTGTYGEGNGDSRLIALSLFLDETDVTVSPGAASLAITEQTPSLDTALKPAAVAIDIAEQVPSLEDIIPIAAAALEIAEETPAVQIGGDFALFPAAAAISISGQVPTVNAPIDLFPSEASLVVTGAVPILDESVTPAAAALAIAGQAPASVLETNVNPPAASLAISGTVILFGVGVGIPQDFLAITGFPPLIGKDFDLTPPPGSLTITGIEMTISGNSIWIPDTPPNTSWIEVEAEDPQEVWTPPALPAAPVWASDAPPAPDWTEATPPAAAVWAADAPQETDWRELRAEKAWETNKLDTTKTEDWDVPTEEMGGGTPRTTWVSGREDHP